MTGSFGTLVRRLLRGFLALPAILALGGILLAAASITLDRSGLLNAWWGKAIPFYALDSDGARDVLSTIAGSTITVVSLIYSLTLVVFALAAGNIGPRILETFADNRITQTTVGVFGGTFLFSIAALALVAEEEVPRLSVCLALLLVTVSFFLLVYFVHDVARRILIDNEIGRTHHNLRLAVNRLLQQEPGEDIPPRKPHLGRQSWTIAAPASGYVIAVDSGALVAAASRADCFIDLPTGPGGFLIEGSVLARVSGQRDKALERRICAAVTLGNTRSPEGDIQFNILLSVEIALRALSPGVNDAFTAIAAIDHLSASLALLLGKGAPCPLHKDKNGEPRLWLERIGEKESLDTAFDPLRRAANGNMLVTHRLVDAIGRMLALVDARHRPLLTRHLRLIAWDSGHSLRNPTDRKVLADRLRLAYAQRPE